MTILRYKYRIYPTKIQEQLLLNSAGACRFLFNRFLKRNIDQYSIDKKFVWNKQMCTELSALKKTEEFSWLTQTDSQALQQSLRDLDQALKNIKHGNGFPKFKSKYITAPSFRIPQRITMSKDEKYVYIPKIGQVRIKLHRALPPFKGVTVFRDASGWYCSFVVEVKELALVTNPTKPIGVDLNSEHTALSDGVLLSNRRPMRSGKHKVKQIQQALSRKRKGSKNREKTKRKLARKHKQIANQRNECLHQQSIRIAKAYDLVITETLNVASMKSVKATAKAVADAAWGTMLTTLKYKCTLYGKHFLQIGQYLPSSQTCSSCGHRQKIPLHIRTHDCSCGNNIHRDINAAINIHNWGYQQWQIENKSGQELSKAPVDVIWDLLRNSGGETQTQMKQEATSL